jgi:uncharacterized protein
MRNAGRPAARAPFVVVTGASQGLGRALAEEWAGRGRNLVLVALPDTGLPEVKRVLEIAYGVAIETVELDLTLTDGPERLAALIEERGIPVDTLANNAGVGYNARFEECSLRQAEAQIQLNVLALVKLTHLLLPELRRHPRGWVLNVASMAAYFPMPRMPVYSPTKSFVLAFGIALREELRGSGVTVTTICPNGIRTNSATRALIARQGLAGRLTCRYPDEVARAAVAGLLRGRAIIVPGALNNLLRVAGALVPRTLSMRVIADRWGRSAARPPRAPRPALRALRAALVPMGSRT